MMNLDGTFKIPSCSGESVRGLEGAFKEVSTQQKQSLQANLLLSEVRQQDTGVE